MLRDLYQLVEPTIRSQPDRPAVMKPSGEEISYRRLGDIVDHYTALCARAGIARGTRVSVHNIRMTEYVFLVLALSRLGAVHVRAPDNEAAGGQGIKADYVIGDPDAELRGTRALALDLAVPQTGCLPAPADLPGFASPDDICTVLATSGTTGLRKQLGYTLAVVEQMVGDKRLAYGPLSGRILVHIPPTMWFGLQMCLLTLQSGGEIVFPSTRPRVTLAMMAAGKVDEVLAAPAMFAEWLKLLAKEPVAFPGIKRAIMGGSLASRTLMTAIQNRVCRNLINHYGASETGGIASAPVDQVAAVKGAIGKLYDWMEARIVDEQGNELARGQVGELQFRLKPGHHVVRVIGGAAEASADGAWFAPGDRGTVTPDGILCVYGRASEMINVGGNKIPCEIVEDVVARFLGGTEPVCALGLPGPNGFDEPVIVVSARHAGRLNEIPACIGRARLRLGHIRCVAIRNFPLGESGKIDRRKLQTMVSGQVSRQSAAPSS